MISTLLYENIPALVKVPEHTHYFERIPVTFKKNRELVREEMIEKGINSRGNIAAASQADTSLLGGTCSTSLWRKVEKVFTDAAWVACKADAKSRGVKVDIYASWTRANSSSGGYLGNGPMTNAVGGARTCTEEGEGDAKTTAITAIYKWTWEGKEGTVTVIGKADANNELIEGPTVQ
jgi:hypothetical protein